MLRIICGGWRWCIVSAAVSSGSVKSISEYQLMVYYIINLKLSLVSVLKEIVTLIPDSLLELISCTVTRHKRSPNLPDSVQ